MGGRSIGQFWSQNITVTAWLYWQHSNQNMSCGEYTKVLQRDRSCERPSVVGHCHLLTCLNQQRPLIFRKTFFGLKIHIGGDPKHLSNACLSICLYAYAQRASIGHWPKSPIDFCSELMYSFMSNYRQYWTNSRTRIRYRGNSVPKICQPKGIRQTGLN